MGVADRSGLSRAADGEQQQLMDENCVSRVADHDSSLGMMMNQRNGFVDDASRKLIALLKKALKKNE